LSETRLALLAIWVRVRTGTATRSPNRTVKTGRSRTPPPNPVYAESMASRKAAPEAVSRVSSSSLVTARW
jgi:hypothetical protein